MLRLDAFAGVPAEGRLGLSGQGVGGPSSRQGRDAEGVADPFQHVQERKLTSAASAAVQQPAAVDHSRTEAFTGENDDDVVDARRRTAPAVAQGGKIGVVFQQHRPPVQIPQRSLQADVEQPPEVLGYQHVSVAVHRRRDSGADGEHGVRGCPHAAQGQHGGPVNDCDSFLGRNVGTCERLAGPAQGLAAEIGHHHGGLGDTHVHAQDVARALVELEPARRPALLVAAKCPLVFQLPDPAALHEVLTHGNGGGAGKARGVHDFGNRHGLGGAHELQDCAGAHAPQQLGRCCGQFRHGVDLSVLCTT